MSWLFGGPASPNPMTSRALLPIESPNHDENGGRIGSYRIVSLTPHSSESPGAPLQLRDAEDGIRNARGGELGYLGSEPGPRVLCPSRGVRPSEHQAGAEVFRS